MSESDPIRVHLGDLEVTCQRGDNVLDLARRHGVFIPSLCHHEALEPVGACRVCLVEAEGPGLRRSLLTACTLRAEQGLRVYTDTEAVQDARRTVVELLLCRAPQAPAIQELARACGVEAEEEPLFAPLAGESDGCVLCGRCVRVCEAGGVGQEGIAFSGRGHGRRVEAAFGRASQSCLGCGTCVRLCPTATLRLTVADGRQQIHRGQTLLSDLPALRCAGCGAAFTTAPAWEQAHPEHDDDAPLCPSCARRVRARTLSAIGNRAPEGAES